MKFLSRLSFLLLLLIPFVLRATDSGFEGKQENPDMEALRKWLQQKRMVTIKEIGGDLSLSGEVRAEMQATHETKNEIKQRGPHGATERAAVAYDIEVNLMLDYLNDRTWASIKLEFDDDAGTVSGKTDKIQLERAFFGGRVYDGDTLTFDMDLGRRNLSNVFDSKVQYSSIFDGLLLRLSKASEAMGDYYISGGPFLVNDRFNHYAYVFEMGMLNVGSTGFYSKFSFIDWSRYHHYPAEGSMKRFHFINSQVTLGYQFTVSKWQDKLVKFYTAALYNWDAKRLAITHYEKYNYAFYTGVSVGQVRKAKDWALDVNFQYVAPQAVPDFDMGGIGRGNAAGAGFYTTNVNGTGADITDPELAVGRGNFQGAIADLLYAITNNLTMENSFQFSFNQTNKIGPEMHFWQYEMEFIYAF